MKLNAGDIVSFCYDPEDKEIYREYYTIIQYLEGEDRIIDGYEDYLCLVNGEQGLQRVRFYKYEWYRVRMVA